MKYSPKFRELKAKKKPKTEERFASGHDDWDDFLDEDLDILGELDHEVVRDIRSNRFDDEW